MASKPNPSSTLHLRRVHRMLGVAGAPLMIISALGGGFLLLRKTGLYERKGPLRDFVQSLHCYELLLPYIGLLVCGLMIAVALSGLLLFARSGRASAARAKKTEG